MFVRLNEISPVFEQRLTSNNIRGYAVTLNFENLHETFTSGARFAKGDLNTGVISFQLKLEGKPISISDTAVVYVNIENPVYKYLYQTCDILDAEQGIVMVKLKTQAMDEIGRHRIEVVVQPSEQEKLISPKMTYEVYESLEGYQTQPAEDEIGIANALITEVAGTNRKIQADEDIRQHNENVRIANEVLRQQKLQETMDIYHGQIVLNPSEIDTIIANALK